MPLKVSTKEFEYVRVGGTIKYRNAFAKIVRVSDPHYSSWANMRVRWIGLELAGGSSMSLLLIEDKAGRLL